MLLSIGTSAKEQGQYSQNAEPVGLTGQKGGEMDESLEEVLREKVTKLVENCADVGTLDLIYKLLLELRKG